LVGLALPFAAWFIASDYFLLSRMNTFWVTLGAALIMAGIFRLSTDYLYDGFARSYAAGGTWDYLFARFGVDSRPKDIQANEIWTGFSQLDRNDVVFETEAGVSEYCRRSSTCYA
jgi:hypothetical protein